MWKPWLKTIQKAGVGVGRTSHLQAGSAPASSSRRSVVLWAAAEATCSRVKPDESTGWLRSTSSDCSGVSAGTWRRVQRPSTSPTLQAVKSASLRPNSPEERDGGSRDMSRPPSPASCLFFSGFLSSVSAASSSSSSSSSPPAPATTDNRRVLVLSSGGTNRSWDDWLTLILLPLSPPLLLLLVSGALDVKLLEVGGFQRHLHCLQLDFTSFLLIWALLVIFCWYRKIKPQIFQTHVSTATTHVPRVTVKASTSWPLSSSVFSCAAGWTFFFHAFFDTLLSADMSVSFSGTGTGVCSFYIMTLLQNQSISLKTIKKKTNVMAKKWKQTKVKVNHEEKWKTAQTTSLLTVNDNSGQHGVDPLNFSEGGSARGEGQRSDPGIRFQQRSPTTTEEDAFVVGRRSHKDGRGLLQVLSPAQQKILNVLQTLGRTFVCLSAKSCTCIALKRLQCVRTLTDSRWFFFGKNQYLVTSPKNPKTSKIPISHHLLDLMNKKGGKNPDCSWSSSTIMSQNFIGIGSKWRRGNNGKRTWEIPWK